MSSTKFRGPGIAIVLTSDPELDEEEDSSEHVPSAEYIEESDGVRVAQGDNEEVVDCFELDHSGAFHDAMWFLRGLHKDAEARTKGAQEKEEAVMDLIAWAFTKGRECERRRIAAASPRKKS